MASTMNGGAWSYSVPIGALEETDGNARPAPLHSDLSPKYQERERDARSGPRLEKRSSARDLMSDSEATRQRRTSMRASSATAKRKISRNQLRDKNQPEERPAERVDDSAWIHRDKLAQIEIQEMEAAGIYVRPSHRSMSAGPGQADRRSSRSQSRSRRPASRSSHERQNEIINDEDYAAAYPAYDESPRKRVSTVPSAAEEDYKTEQGPAHSTLENDSHQDPEIAAQNLPRQPQHAVRPSTSRIPISRATPSSASQGTGERDTHSRAGSQNWNGGLDEAESARRMRSPSAGSQAFDSWDGARTSPPGTSNKTTSKDGNSPPKGHASKKTGPNARNTSISTTPVRPGSSQQNKATPSTKKPDPGNGTGHKRRPSGTYHPPEGDPPWLATMYKPDPRLPPDQQMLPTHAKRMMQEQWEQERKSDTIYDREFKLLNEDEYPNQNAPILSPDNSGLIPQPRSPSPRRNLSPHPDNTSPLDGSSGGGPWPLNSPNKPEHGGARPGTSGGYRITPTIPDPANIQRSAAASPTLQAVSSPPFQTTRIPELDEKQEAAPKKGCCCVVM